ncbi:gas vesicle protein K [Streptomyces sp. V4I23]|uniref:gas vesicle protein K n=1 Tax=Streptomyces sp. V4I23 TaxID=3042282 RepID=UPI00358F11E3
MWCTSISAPSSGRSRRTSPARGEARQAPGGKARTVTPEEDPVSGEARTTARRLETDPETVERDLIKLVLSLVELLRQLMERTALHRVDEGDLSEDQEERVGMTLMILQERMAELCDRYDLTMDDLNIDLGPLGSLLPRHTD